MGVGVEEGCRQRFRQQGLLHSRCVLGVIETSLLPTSPARPNPPPSQQNVVFALSNAATKGSTAARKAITALGLDRLHPGQQLDAAGASFRRRLQRWESEVSRASHHGSSAGAAAGAAPSGSHSGGHRREPGSPAATAAVMFSPREAQMEGPGEQPGGGEGGMLGAVLLGFAGLAAEPIRGLDEGESSWCQLAPADGWWGWGAAGLLFFEAAAGAAVC